MSEIHHPYSPSTLSGRSKCVMFSPSQRESLSASEGSDIHNQVFNALTKDEEPSNDTARWMVDTVRTLAGDNMIFCEKKVEGTLPGVKGIYGFVDAFWYDTEETLHVVDYKSFSDGTKDHTPQLHGYVALIASEKHSPDNNVVCHILHGGIWQVESFESTIGDSYKRTVNLLNEIKSNTQKKPRLCDFCCFCANVSKCEASMNAVQTVHDNPLSFQNMSLCQKLVVLDAVDKLSEALRKEAKKKAEEAGGAIEEDGIRYEFKPWSDSKLRDIKEVASNVTSPSVATKNGIIECNGISHEELLQMCNLSKTKFIKAMQEANKKNKSVKKVDIERWCNNFYDKVPAAPHFVRTK